MSATRDPGSYQPGVIPNYSISCFELQQEVSLPGLSFPTSQIYRVISINMLILTGITRRAFMPLNGSEKTNLS
jgi:hypothetical protein